MAIVKLDNTTLLEMARSESKTTAYWAKVMHESQVSRQFFKKRFDHFQDHRYWIEMSVKAAVTVTLGVGLFLTAPTTLLFGAALTLSLSSLIFSYYFKLPENNLSVRVDSFLWDPNEENGENGEIAKSSLTEDFVIEDFNELEWQEYRKKWSCEAENHDLDESQKASHTNMTRIGMALVISFAAFTAIASGVGAPLCISSVLFAGSLFHRNIDEQAPYLEDEGSLPALPKPGV